MRLGGTRAAQDGKPQLLRVSTVRLGGTRAAWQPVFGDQLDASEEAAKAVTVWDPAVGEPGGAARQGPRGSRGRTCGSARAPEGEVRSRPDDTVGASGRERAATQGGEYGSPDDTTGASGHARAEGPRGCTAAEAGCGHGVLVPGRTAGSEHAGDAGYGSTWGGGPEPPWAAFKRVGPPSAKTTAAIRRLEAQVTEIRGRCEVRRTLRAQTPGPMPGNEKQAMLARTGLRTPSPELPMRPQSYQVWSRVWRGASTRRRST